MVRVQTQLEVCIPVRYHDKRDDVSGFGEGKHVLFSCDHLITTTICTSTRTCPTQSSAVWCTPGFI